VKVPLKFQRTEFDMVLQMTPAGGLVGLRFLPTTVLDLGGGWQVASYAGDSAHELKITFGKGEFKVGGTLCLPSGGGEQAEMPQFPCFVFLAGSGPCD
jgi:hypothetical protein